MLNWMFTWLRPDGRLTHEDMAPVVVQLSFGGLEYIALPLKRNPAGDAVLHRAQTRARAGTGNALPFTRSTGRVRRLKHAHRRFGLRLSGRLTDSMQTMAVAIFTRRLKNPATGRSAALSDPALGQQPHEPGDLFDYRGA